MHGSWLVFLPLWIVLFIFVRGRFGRRRYWQARRWGPPGEMLSPDETARREEQRGRREEQIESLETRVAELESRLDFTERLLAQKRDQPPLTGPALA